MHNNLKIKNINPLKKLIITMPNFNNSKFLRYSIDSILNQTFKNFDLVIFDDCSTDNSVDMLKDYEKESNIRIIRNSNNLKMNNFNKCLDFKNDSYQFKSILHTDDIYEKYFLDKQLDFFLNNQNVGILLTNSSFIDENNMIIGELNSLKNVSKKLNRNLILDFNLLYKFVLQYHNFCLTPSLMINTEILEYKSYFNVSDFNTAADLGFYFQNLILSKYKLAILEEKLFKWRHHKYQISSKHHLEFKNKSDHMKVMEFYSNDYKFDNRDKSFYKANCFIDRIKYLNQLIINDRVEGQKLRYELKKLIFTYIFSMHNNIIFTNLRYLKWILYSFIIFILSSLNIDFKKFILRTFYK